ncbi:MAG: hypothetical protein U5N26_01010 [Candidatus Marinimicrobia bacterium]|nr:hypothetical protein [Candidatus Neomarinimicrobiota bacterium]
MSAYEGRINASQSKLENPALCTALPKRFVEHEQKKLGNYRETLALLKENHRKLDRSERYDRQSAVFSGKRAQESALRALCCLQGKRLKKGRQESQND